MTLTQSVAKDYQAPCTPYFFVFDDEDKRSYHEAMNNSHPANEKVITGKGLAAALERLSERKPSQSNPKTSIDCNIKWKIKDKLI